MNKLKFLEKYTEDNRHFNRNLELSFRVKSENYIDRMYIANYNDLPSEYLDLLVKDENLTVRAFAAVNPNLSPEHINTLIKDEEWQVRRTIASHKNITKDNLEVLIKDENSLVAEMAQCMLKNLLQP